MRRSHKLAFEGRIVIEEKLFRYAVRHLNLYRSLVENDDNIVLNKKMLKEFLVEYGFSVGSITFENKKITVNYINKQKEDEKAMKGFRDVLYYHPFVKNLKIDTDKNLIEIIVSKPIIME